MMRTLWISCLFAFVIIAPGARGDSGISVTVSRAAGGDVTLTCTVAGLGKRRVVWSRPELAVPISVGGTRFLPGSYFRVKVVDKESVALTVRRQRSGGHVGEYRCGSTGGGASKVVTVEADAAGDDGGETRLLGEGAREVTAGVGRAALLPCHVASLNTRMVMWLDPNGDVVSLRRKVYKSADSRRVKHDSASEWALQLRRVAISDFGDWTCVVNARPLLTRTVTLVNSAPAATAPVFDRDAPGYKVKQEVMEGQSVTFTCGFKASPPAKITWFKQDRVNGKWELKELGVGASWTLRAAGLADAGRYVCRGDNGVPGDADAARGRTRLAVKPIPTTQPPTTTTFKPTGPSAPRVTAPEPRVGIHRGGRVTLTCNAVAWPRPELYWRRNGRRLVRDHQHAVTEQHHGRHGKTSQLLVRSVSRHDYGSYQCVARNVNGLVEVHVDVYETQRT